ncbi:MAG: ParB/RepB/Spo0J family partition protein [Hyphomicrobiaceae bacterium]|nr:ParB/RepB/Spo0J family partition protein [Hyphomicrobiaceae bacterium]
MSLPQQKGRLGRGLASLIGEMPSNEQRLPAHGEQRLVSIDQLHPSAFNPRKTFNEEELAELANSIRTRGLVQPILARPDAARGGYEIVAGERRWRAAQRAQLHQVPVIVRDLNDQEVAEAAIIENVQRSDLNSIEEANGYSELMERYGYTQEQLSDVIGKSRSHLANTLRLLKLPTGVQTLVREGKLTAGHARALIGRDDAETLAKRIVDQEMSVRAVESMMQDIVKPGAPKGGKPREPLAKDPDTRAFEKDLSDSLGLKVEIKRGSGESGVLTISYGNFEQLDYIRTRLVGPQSY